MTRRFALAATLAALLTTAPAGLPAASFAAPLRLATYNIHHAQGEDGALDLRRVADTVRGADLVAFQEVDVRFRDRSGGVDQAEALRAELGGHVAFGANLVEGQGAYGVALVSRFPITSSKNHRLPHSPGREKAEPRGLLEATVDVEGRAIRVYVTHLSHDSRPDRMLQIDRVKEVIASGRGPYVLMGDLNFRPDSEEYAKLAGDGATGPFVDAWPRVAKGPGATIGLDGKNPGRIDYVFASPDLADGLVSARVDAKAIASDHKPLFVEMNLPAR